MKRFFCFIFFALSFIFCAPCHAEDEGYRPKMFVYQKLNNDSILRAFKCRFAELDTIIAKAVRVPTPTMTGVNCVEVNSRLDSLFAQKALHERRAFLSRNGLEMTGQLYGRLDNLIGLAGKSDADNEDEVSVYLAKLQAELGWNIFNSRFHKRRAHLRKIELENKLGLLKESRVDSKEVFEEITNTLTERYNFYLAVVLYHRLSNIDLLNEAYQYMLEQDRIANDKLLDIINDKMQVEYDMSQVCDAELIGDEPLYVVQPTILSIDTTALYSRMEASNTALLQSLMQEEILNNDKLLTTYSTTMRLSPFARWSSYITSHWGYSHNFDLGVRFTFPLYNDSRRKRQAIDAQVAILQNTRETFVKEKRAFCSLRLSRIQRLNQAIRTEDFHTKQLRKYVTMRNNAYRNSSNGYNYLIRMQEYNEYLKSLERQYKLMLQRTLQLIEIQKETGLTDLSGIISETEIQ